METVSHLFSFYTYLQKALRKLQIRHSNRQIAAKNAASILCLPDDILFMVFDLLQEGDRESLPMRRLALQANSVKNKPQNTNGHEGDFIRFSTSNRRIRNLARARILRTITLGTSWSPERASKALTTLSKSPNASEYVREVKVDIWEANAFGCERTTTISPKKLLKFSFSFLNAAHRLENLQKLAITVPASTAYALHYAFRGQKSAEPKVRLEEVRELELSPFMHWIIDCCPNVRRVESNDWVIQSGVARHDQVQAIIEAAGRAPFLEHFALHCRWRRELLEQIIDKMPDLKSLALRRGQFAADMRYMLGIVKRLEHLEVLALPDAPQVGHILGLDGWCSSFSMGKPSFFQYEVVTRKVFRELRHLDQLCLGAGFQARLSNQESREIDVRWDYGPADCAYQGPGEWIALRSESECSFERKVVDRFVEEETQLRLLQEEMAM
ncbi:hypothetical protein PRZ48_014299 [Zasmidium cellare]|uniref:F-box domain-containing protein n=1 Tax=Zasmidium cellare TaxID=395010 RepID=A0ABR0E0J4_ZASCE|nr:hypothetical protein PRZ48_014299 [Zasmidium cellare]